MANLKAKAVLVLITILAVSPAQSEQVTIPGTAAGRVLAAWLEAFNSGDQARFGVYQQKYEPAPDLPPDAVMAFRARTGGFDLVGIHKSEPLHIEFLVVVPDVKAAAADALTTAQKLGTEELAKRRSAPSVGTN